MTTAPQSFPKFPTTPRGHPALRAAVILGLCASLVAGFVAASSRAPTPGTGAAAARSIACDASAAARHAC